MRTSLRTRAALRLANWIERRAREIQCELQDHVRNETLRLALADKRLRGLRLYAAWSGARSRPAACAAVVPPESSAQLLQPISG